MLDALCSENDVDAASDDRLRPLQCRAGRELHEVDEIALVLLRNESGRRLGELDAGNADQPGIDHEHEDGCAHEATRQAPVAEREPLEAPIEAIEGAVEQASRQDAAGELMSLMRLEQHGAKGGAERQRDEA